MANPLRQTGIFWGEMINELKKSSWPSRRELRDYTLIVFVTILILGTFISLCDFSVYNWVIFLTKIIRPETGG